MTVTHEIRTLDDVLVAVTPENIDGFMADFGAWLRMSFGDYRPATFAPIFRWHDDGDYGTLSDVRITVVPAEKGENVQRDDA